MGFEPTGLLQLISNAALSLPIPKLQAYSRRHIAHRFSSVLCVLASWREILSVSIYPGNVNGKLLIAHTPVQ
jgi:hypothetical protein